MCKVISVISYKGGVGKTTSAVNLSSYIQMHGKRVCAIDLDPQGNLSSHFGIFPGQLKGKPTMYNLIQGLVEDLDDSEMSELVQQSICHSTTVDVIPSIPRLANTEKSIPMATNCEGLVRRLVSFLKDNYDFIFIDIHSGWDIFSVNAMTASDSIIIPVEAHGFSYEGIAPILGMIHTVQTKLNPDLKIEGIIITKFQKVTTLCNQISDAILQNFGTHIPIFPDYVRYEIKVAEAPTFGISIHEYAPSSDAAHTYANIASEVMSCA